jgi:hypothetical protein
MRPESVCKSTAQDVTHTTPDLLRNRAHFSRLCYPEQTLKTSLESTNREKTLTVPESLFRRESMPLSMYDWMESMVINQCTFCVCLYLLTFLLREYEHRVVWGVKSKGLGAPRTKGGVCRPGGDVDWQFQLKAIKDSHVLRPSTDHPRPWRVREGDRYY